MTCPLCNEPHEACLCFDTCEACGEKAYSYPRCRECGSADIGYLHDAIARDWQMERGKDPETGNDRIAA